MRYCAHCGKEIHDQAVICINCGCRTEAYTYKADSTEKANAEPTTATWSKICGIVSFFFGWIVLGIAAIILAHVSKKDTDNVMCPSAKVGYICGIISTVIDVVVIIGFMLFLGDLMSFMEEVIYY